MAAIGSEDTLSGFFASLWHRLDLNVFTVDDHTWKKYLSDSQVSKKQFPLWSGAFPRFITNN